MWFKTQFDRIEQELAQFIPNFIHLSGFPYGRLRLRFGESVANRNKMAILCKFDVPNMVQWLFFAVYDSILLLKFKPYPQVYKYVLYQVT